MSAPERIWANEGLEWHSFDCSDVKSGWTHPYILATPAALAASPEVQKLVAEAEARGMERAAKLVPTGYTFWAKKPHNARWARKIDGTPIPNDLPVCIQEIIHAEAAAIRRAEGELT